MKRLLELQTRIGHTLLDTPPKSLRHTLLKHCAWKPLRRINRHWARKHIQDLTPFARQAEADQNP